MEKKSSPPKRGMTLDEVVKQYFVGPIALKAQRAQRDLPESRKLVAVNLDELDALEGINADTIIFPVAAFVPRIGISYQCFLRQRGGIIEAMPANRRIDWKPDAIPTGKLVLKKDQRSRWSSRIDKTGQMILPHKNLVPPTESNTWEKTGLYIRPAATRTFWIAGTADDLVRITPNDEGRMVVYENGHDKPDYSYATQFRLFGKFYTFAEVAGDPLAGTIEFDSYTITNVLETAGKELERWTLKVLLPALHPDVVSQKNNKPGVVDRVMEMAEETRNSIHSMVKWYQGFLADFLPDYRRRRAAGFTTMKPRLPEPIGRKTRNGPPLITAANSREAIDRLLYEQPKPKRQRPAPKPKTPKQAEKPTPSATVTPTPETPTVPPTKPRGKPKSLQVDAPPPFAQSSDNTGNGNSIAEALKAKGVDTDALTKKVNGKPARRTTKKSAATTK